MQSRAVICGTYHLEKAQYCTSDTISKMALFLFISLTLKQGRVIQDSSRCPPREGGREGGREGREGNILEGPAIFIARYSSFLTPRYSPP